MFNLNGYINKLVFVVAIPGFVILAGCSDPRHAEYLQYPATTYGHVQALAQPLQPNFDAQNREEYNKITENRFLSVLEQPLSTFSADVDTASYSNIRRFISKGQMPMVDAVRIEEMVNYFSYDYPQPTDNTPFSITTEIGVAPWNTKHKLVHIGLKGREIAEDRLPPANIVFLIDVSGSMYSRLPLVKSSLNLLVNKLRAQDKLSIVVYAGAAGLVLPPTTGSDKVSIRNAIENLQAGGSTAGGEGIRLAYQVALENFIKDGNNRVVLATDGDFNVGASSQADLQNLIEQERNKGVFLTVLGFGMGNYRDGLMETLANKGNGNYAYIDSMLEAKKSLVTEFGGTLFTIAKDVKLQVQFNPSYVEKYRLIGYENRLLHNEDFANDKKDAGDIGAGHTVTALYEIIPNTAEASVDKPRYVDNTQHNAADELLFVKIRYKEPDAGQSKLIEKAIHQNDNNTNSERFQFSAAVAEFGMLLRNSEFKSNASYQHVVMMAKRSKGNDPHGYRSEFISLVETVAEMAKVTK